MKSACGVLCSQCPAYLATARGPEYQQQTAAAWERIYRLSVTAEQLACGGCLAPDEEVFHTSRGCEARLCCRERGLGSCAECDEDDCAKLAKAQAAWDGVPGLAERLSTDDFATYCRPYCGHRERLAAARQARRERQRASRAAEAASPPAGPERVPQAMASTRRSPGEVNNAIYETLGHRWWNDDAGFEMTSLRHCVNPVRCGYFRRILRERGVRAGSVLDVGCGGGYLAEEFAKDGFRVYGLDPATSSIEAARAHAAGGKLDIDYRVGRGEALPFADASFDVIACCDVLEHVEDLRRVVDEVARVLKPGGILLFDTVNRTAKSKLTLIKVWQDWNVGGFGVPNAHVWDRFITPAEMEALLRASGIEPGGMKGMGPVKSPVAHLTGLLKVRSGRLSGARVAEAFGMRETDDLSVSYLGWASKASR